MNGMNLPPGFNFDNIPENDLNQVWKILTQLQTSNPKKYRDFIDHVKLEEEKREKLSKIVPLPHSVLGLISPFDSNTQVLLLWGPRITYAV